MNFYDVLYLFIILILDYNVIINTIVDHDLFK